MIESDASWRLFDTIKSIASSNGQSANAMATCVRVLSDGTRMMQLVGSSILTPLNGSMAAEISQGDMAEVRIEDGVMSLTANVSNPSVGQSEVNDAVADKATVRQLGESNARIEHLEVTALTAESATIANLQADTAKVHDLTADQLTAATAYVGALDAGNVTAAQLIADHATVGALDSTYAKVDMANVNNAWINNGTIKNGAIVSAMINDVSANKLTAGTINGSVINVTNLNADNITTGTINGQRIGEGSLSLDKLAEDVYTEAEVNSIVDGLNDRIDGAIETFTGTAVPTLNNQPASSWNTTKLRDEHVGDVYYVVNSQSQQNGYCYRFTKSGSSYSWQLIKDSDVTAALQRLTTAEGKIGTIEQFDSDISAWKTDTDEELSSMKTAHNTLAGRVTTAEGTLATKVDTTTFNNVKQTVDENSSSITQLTTTTTQLRADVDGIEIGGRNLLLATAGGATTAGSTNSSVFTKAWTISDYGQSVMDNTDDVFTWSFDYEVTGNEATGAFIYARIRGSAIAYTDVHGVPRPQDVYENPTGHYSRSVRLTSTQVSSATQSCRIRLQSATDGAVLKVWNVKVEKGTKGSDWTAAPEDLESTVTTVSNKVSEHTQTINGFTTRIGALETTIETKADGSTVETVSNKLNTVSDTVDGHTRTISSVQDTLATKADNSTVSTLTTKVNTVSDTVDGHTSQLSRVQTRVENSDPNMLLDWNAPSKAKVDAKAGRYFSNSTYTEIKPSFFEVADPPMVGIENGVRFVCDGSAHTSARGRGLAFYDEVADTALAFVDGQAYTASWWARCTDGSGQTYCLYINGGTNTTKNNGRRDLTSEWQLFTETFKPVKCSDYGSRVWFFGHFPANVSGTIELCGFKCVPGDSAENVATSVTTLSNDYATFKQTVETFESTVGETYATKTALATTDGNVSALATRVSTAETSIQQNRDAIALRATKTEAYQVAQPNLTPYFSMPMTATTDDYWYSITFSHFTQLEDGWAHFENSNSGSSTVNNYIKPKAISTLVPGGKYTLLAEFRNVSITGPTNGDFYSQQAAEGQIWGASDATGGFTIYNSALANLEGGAGVFYKSLTTLDAESKDPSGTVRGTLPKLSFMSINQQVVAGQSISYDVRLSLYEGEYTGPYKPYTGPQLYATNAELKVTAEGISSTVERVGGFKYLESASAGASLSNIKTYAADGRVGNWWVKSINDVRVGDFVYIKYKDTTRNCDIYVKGKVLAINSSTNIKLESHGYEDVLPVETIKSTINQSADSVKIQAKHIEIDGTAVFSAISSDVDDAITGKGYQTSSQVESAITSKGYATTTQAQGYAGTAQSNAISAAAADATTKANTAKSEAISAAATDATNKANAAESNAKSYADDIEVGGRNLAKASDAVVTPTKYNALHIYLSEPLEAEQTYVFQLWDIDVSHSAKPTALLGVDVYYCGGVIKMSGWHGSNYFTNGHADHLKLTLTPHSSAATDAEGGSESTANSISGASSVANPYINLYNSAPEASGTMNLTVGKWKLEKGNRATDWTPAPEDISNEIDGVRTTANAAAPKADAVARSQRIYYRKTSSGAPSANTTWLATSGTGYGNWSLNVPQLTNNGTKYPYLYTAVQTQTVAQQAAGTTCSCSAVLIDDSSTVIDGGNIITGTVSANAINAASGTFDTANIPALTANHIKANVIDAVNNGTGTINADKINVSSLTIDQQQVTGLTTALNDKADSADIPTKVSDLTNDSGYQTSTQVDTAITSKGYATTTQAQEYADAIEIGGRNLLLGTDGDHTVTLAAAASDYYIGYFDESDYGLALTNGNTSDYLTVQFDWSTTSNTGVAWLQIDGNIVANISVAEGYGTSKDRINLSDGSGHYRATFKLTSTQAGKSTQRMRLRIAGSSTAQTAGSTFTLSNLKFEKGTKATDWSVAPEDIDAAIDESAKTATNYITHVDNNGITIHPQSGTSNRVAINANGMEVFKGNASVASYGDTARIGAESGNNVMIDTDGMKVRSGTSVLAQFASSLIEIGKNSTSAVVKFCNGMTSMTSEVVNSIRRFVIESTNVIEIRSSANGATSGTFGIDLTVPPQGSFSLHFVPNTSNIEANLRATTLRMADARYTDYSMSYSMFKVIDMVKNLIEKKPYLNSLSVMSGDGDDIADGTIATKNLTSETISASGSLEAADITLGKGITLSGIKFGFSSATTNSNGITTFNPGLGVAPTAVFVAPGKASNETEAVAKIAVPMVWSIDSATQVQVRWQHSDTNAWLASNAVGWYWLALYSE